MRRSTRNWVIGGGAGAIAIALGYHYFGKRHVFGPAAHAMKEHEKHEHDRKHEGRGEHHHHHKEHDRGEH
jgi:hypothetical protein